jgi:hypothetical protein
MILPRIAVVALMLANGASAQGLTSGEGAMLRGLDRVSGAVSELDVSVGGTVDYGRLRIGLSACRYPADNPEGEAFAFLEIHEAQRGELLFRGWMIASSPALNALDHSRYDVWVLNCR